MQASANLYIYETAFLSFTPFPTSLSPPFPLPVAAELGVLSLGGYAADDPPFRVLPEGTFSHRVSREVLPSSAPGSPAALGCSPTSPSTRSDLEEIIAAAAEVEGCTLAAPPSPAKLTPRWWLAPGLCHEVALR